MTKAAEQLLKRKAKEVPISHAQVKDMLRRAVLTLAAVPDPDLRHRLGAKGSWPLFVQEMRDAYGSAPPKFRSFHPTSHDLSMFLDLLGMLGWYEREWGTQTVRIFRAWAFGAAMWQLQERCSTDRRRPASPNTVRNRINGMVSAIIEEFPEQLFHHQLDELHELAQNAAADEHGGDIASTDARSLPRPKNAWSLPSEPMSAGEKIASHKALEKRLEKNKSRALDRKQKAARR